MRLWWSVPLGILRIGGPIGGRGRGARVWPVVLPLFVAGAIGYGVVTNVWIAVTVIVALGAGVALVVTKFKRDQRKIAERVKLLQRRA